MKVTYARPPNFEKIAAAFKSARRPDVVFCYGDTIYNPNRQFISPALFAHEAVHSARQGKDPESWWDMYIASEKFRFNEELLAHRREYEVAAAGLTRNQRRQILRQLGNRLASSLYGALVSKERARALIADANAMESAE